MRYYATSVSAMLAAYVLAFSSLGYLAFSWRYGLHIDSAKWVTLWACSVVALGISLLARKVENRAWLEKWQNEADSKFTGIH